MRRALAIKEVMKREKEVRGEKERRRKKRERKQAKHSGARVLSLIWEYALAAAASSPEGNNKHLVLRSLLFILLRVVM